jgi:hypothetical protein
METSIKVSSKMTRDMGLDNMFGLKDQNTSENGSKEKSKEMEKKLMPMET